jgi:hypothetical protein
MSVRAYQAFVQIQRQLGTAGAIGWGAQREHTP